ncbi:hypothetical protein N7535_008515 [Penicillium sp. DV-2018c]|nr:hypothetical protein N7461_002274 [Penicillium sp. DV-2018c]KAJ5563351.1 hypothetical protein N7535_008515 [Penicillium sp. DV-2018c]
MEESVLLCVICPRKPKFSDISHLVTHAASKSHLSNQFKLSIRRDDPDAVELLRQYDDFIKTHDLNEKLVARMKQTEDRKKKKKAARASASTTAGPVNRAPNVEPLNSIAPVANSGSAHLNPCLVDGHTGEQQKKYATLTPTTPDRLPTMSSNERSDRVLRSMQFSYGDDSNVLQPANVLGLDDKHRPLTLPVTPTQPPRHLNHQDRTWGPGEATFDPFVDCDNDTEIPGDAGIDKDRADEMATLKGVQWQGMGMFDSATPEMRRRRNQKKDDTVLKHMENDSLLAQPDELIFDAEGNLVKQRLITGNVEQYSPLKGETPIPNRRVTRALTKRLTRADPNVPRAADRRRQKTAARNGRNRAEKSSVGEKASVRRSHFGAARIQSPDGLGEDFGLTYKPHGNKSRGRFEVFTDEEQGMLPSDHQPTMEHKGPIDTVTPTRLVLDGKTNSGIQSGIGAPAVAKENLVPILNSQGRIGPQAWNNSFASHPDTGGYDVGNGHFSLEDTYGGNGNTEWNPSHYFNPLCPAPQAYQQVMQAPRKTEVNDNGSFHANHYDESTETQDSWLSMDQIIPSEETIPEEDCLFSTFVSADMK